MKAKCKEAAKTSRCNLRKVFNDVTRSDPAGRKISFPSCESTMYRCRRKLQPKIPQMLSGLDIQLPGTIFGMHFKASSFRGADSGFIFFSDEITSIMLDIFEICFDGTFFTLPVQFYQLWTIFIVIDQHVLPAIHCLLTGKSEELYQAVLSKIQEILPEFQPQIEMSDWEQAARNAFKTLFIGIKLQGCWFHYTQRIWKKVQKVNLATTYTNNGAFQNYLRCIMALPFLPPDEIQPTYEQITTQNLNLEKHQMDSVEKLKLFVRRRWINPVLPEELSVWHQKMATNNGAENYHGRLKSLIKCCKPRILNFLYIEWNYIGHKQRNRKIERRFTDYKGEEKEKCAKRPAATEI